MVNFSSDGTKVLLNTLELKFITVRENKKIDQGKVRKFLNWDFVAILIMFELVVKIDWCHDMIAIGF